MISRLSWCLQARLRSSHAAQVTDADIAALQGATQLTALQLDKMPFRAAFPLFRNCDAAGRGNCVSDAGLASIAAHLTALRRLHLNSSHNITNAGLQQLTALRRLSRLALPPAPHIGGSALMAVTAGMRPGEMQLVGMQLSEDVLLAPSR